MKERLIKKRKFAVTGIKDQRNADEIKESLMRKAGMIEVDVDCREGFVRIKYDLKKTKFETIEESIKEIGFGLSQKIKEKLKRGMAKFTEQNELDNLTASPSSCCSDPKEAVCRSKSRNF